MEIIEFRTKIKNGNIRIPKKFNRLITSTVRIILIADQEPGEPDIIDKLLENPIEIEHFSPYLRKEIYERI